MGSLSPKKSCPSLPTLLCQLHNYLKVASAMNIVFMHMLPGSRSAIFVEGNFLVANLAHNVSPLFASNSSQRWRVAPYKAVILIACIQGPHPTHQSLARFSLGPHPLLLLDLHGRFHWALPGLFCHNFLWRLTTPVPRRFSPTFTPQQRFL